MVYVWVLTKQRKTKIPSCYLASVMQIIGSYQLNKKPVMILDYNQRKRRVDMFDENLEEFSCPRKTVRWPLLIFYNIINAVANNTYYLLRKVGEYKPSKKAFLKKLTFDLAKPAAGIRLSLFNQKHSLRSAVVLVRFPAPSVLAESPNTIKTSRIIRCMKCRKLTHLQCDDCGGEVCPRHWQLVKTCKCGLCVSAVN